MSLGLDLLRGLDPSRLAGVVGMDPDPWQHDVLRSRAKRILINASRQSGKSTTTALKALHTAAYVPDSLVLLISPSQRQSSELYAKVRAVYRKLGRPVPISSENATTMVLENGSRIVALPGVADTIRGYSGAALLIIDEAAQVDDEIYLSVMPMVAVSGGTVIALSTPYGLRGWWSDAWHEEGSRWERIRITAEQCPRISPEFLAEQRLSMGEWFYQQEFCCEFRSTTDAVFSADLIRSLFDSNFEPFRL